MTSIKYQKKQLPPPGALSMSALRKQVGISKDLMHNILNYLQLTPVYSFKNKNWYSAESRELIESFLITHPDTRRFFLSIHGVQNKPEEEKKQIYDKVAQTCLERYGVSNVSKSTEFQQLKEDNFIKTHGESFSTYMTKKSSLNANIRHQTCLERYGEDYAHSFAIKGAQNRSEENRKETAQKLKNTCLNKYGVTNPSQIPAVKIHIRESLNKNKEEALNFVKEHNGITEQDVCATYNISDPCFRYHVCSAGLLLKKYKNFNYIDLSALDKIKSNLQNVQHSASTEEESVYVFLKSIYNGEIQRNTRSILRGKELDFYMPDKKVAIEFNGLYWHSSASGKDNSYHLEKTKECEKMGIRLIQIYEDEWRFKRPICESIIKSALNLSSRRIFARKCIVKNIDKNTYCNFMNINHIQGAGPSPKEMLGLFYEGELIQAIGLGNSRYKEREIELYRMASVRGATVVGGFSKLLKHSSFNTIVTYVDRRLFSGVGYRKIGFVLISETPPSYFYIKGANRYNRLSFQKHKLKTKLKNFDPNKTEKENMFANGYDIIYDCGTFKMVYKNNCNYLVDLSLKIMNKC